MIDYIPIGGLAVLIIGVLIKVSSDVQKRPTYREIDSDYQRTEVCEVITKNMDENFAEIKSDLKKLLYKNSLK